MPTDDYTEEQFANMLATGDVELDFDPANADAPAPRDPLPPGNYWADIAAAEAKQGPKAPFIKLQLSVPNPTNAEDRPWKVFENVSLSLKSKWRLDQLYAALYGKEEAGHKRLNVLELVGRSCLVHLGQERDNKGVMRNNVINFIALGTEGVELVGDVPAPAPAEAADPQLGWGSNYHPAETVADIESPVEDATPMGDDFDRAAPTAAPPKAAPAKATTARPAAPPARPAPAKPAAPPAKVPPKAPPKAAPAKAPAKKR